MDNVSAVIIAAEDRLRAYAHDPAHDLEHHSDVALLALEIAANIEPSSDSEALAIACMWHDVGEPDRRGAAVAADLATQEMKKHDMPEAFIATVDTAIRFHEYGDQPKNIEGKILFDADKLTILSPERWTAMADGVDKGLVTLEYARSALQTVFTWTPQLHGVLQFPYSQDLLSRFYEKLIADPRAAELAKKVGLDIADLHV